MTPKFENFWENLKKKLGSVHPVWFWFIDNIINSWFYVTSPLLLNPKNIFSSFIEIHISIYIYIPITCLFLNLYIFLTYIYHRLGCGKLHRNPYQFFRYCWNSSISALFNIIVSVGQPLGGFQFVFDLIWGSL